MGISSLGVRGVAPRDRQIAVARMARQRAMGLRGSVRESSAGHAKRAVFRALLRSLICQSEGSIRLALRRGRLLATAGDDGVGARWRSRLKSEVKSVTSLNFRGK